MIKGTVCVSQILLLVLALAGSIYSLKPTQKRILVAICCCVAIFSLLALKFTQTFCVIEEEITITALNKKCDESRGTEIDISNLRVDGSIIASYDFVSGNWYKIGSHYAWRPPEDTRWDGTASDSITLKVPVGWARSIQFYSTASRGYAAIEKPNGTKEIVNTYSKETETYSCEIGRSATALLLLQGTVNILSYALILGALTGLFIWGIKKESAGEKPEGPCKKREVQPALNSKRQWIKSGLFACILAILVAIFSVANLRDRLKTEALILATGEQTESMPITEGEPYTQIFTANGTFNQIQLRFCSYGRENRSSTTIRLVNDATGALLESWEIENDSISKNAIKFSLNEDQSKGVYRLIVEGHNPDAETSIGIYLQDKSVYNGELFVSENPHNKNISIGLYQETNLGFFLLAGILTAAIICAWLAYVLLFIRRQELWKTAFALILAFGCVYLAVFPAGCINDSWRHYLTAYQYSNDLLGVAESNAGTVMMRKDDCDEFLRYRGLPRTASIATYYEEFDEFSMWCQSNALTDCGEKSLPVYSDSSAVSEIAYFPQVLGLTLGRVLSLGTIPCIFLARFFQLLSVAALVSVAIQIIPSQKEILLLIALLPIFLQQITAFSYDGIAFGTAFLFIAICMKLIQQTEKISVSDYALLIITTFGLCACRGGMYIFLLILFALIPHCVLRTFSKIYLSGMGMFIVLSFFGKVYLGTSSMGGTSTLTFGSPFQHPIRVGLHFISSVIENIDLYWSGSFGQQMGWSESLVPHFVAYGFMILALIASLNNDYNHVQTLSKKARVIYLLPVVMTLGICLGAMYFGESERATKWNIWGVQGRYFIPVMPLIFFQAQNQYVVMKKNIRPAVICAFCAWETIEIFYLMRAFLMR